MLSSFFCCIVVCFSMPLPAVTPRLNHYYGYIFWALAFSLAAVHSSSLVVLAVFWGLSGLMLYLLANLTPGASNAAKKSFIFIGGSDALIILGIGLIWSLTGTFDMARIAIPLQDASLRAYAAFAFLTIGALTKAGAMPFHTWIPDFAATVPLPLTAFLPASLDKLLGIFLLVIICTNLFVLTVPVSFVLLVIGAGTIICAVFMAMVQHDLRRLLSYHAVSQVGYMVMGIATGTPLGIAAGVFHMINHSLYKSGLFLTAASVEHYAGTTDLDRLGGLSRFLPVTFTVCVITSLSISGIPLLNGFVSKWMVYQALIQSAVQTAGAVRIAGIGFIIIAMFGSALTLASFMKLLHAVFLGQPSSGNRQKPARESFWMILPMSILALFCVLFGIFPYALPLQQLITPGLASIGIAPAEIPGLWQADTATVIIITGLLIGFLFSILPVFRFRKDRAFIGGEDVLSAARVSGADFYTTISNLPVLRSLYAAASRRFFDLYTVCTGGVLAAGSLLSRLHSGNLSDYLVFVLIGCAGMFIYLVR